MALSAERVVEFEGPVEKLSCKVTASDIYYRGAILVLKGSTGYAAVPSDTAAEYAAGIYNGKNEEGTDYAYSVGSGENPRVEVERGPVWLPLGSAAITDVGDLAYISDDQSLTKTAGSKTIAYVIRDFKTGYVLIDLREPIKAS